MEAVAWPRPDAWVWGEPLPSPAEGDRPVLVMAFNLECPGCVRRGVPFLKRLAAEAGEGLRVALLHTAYGRRRYPREEVVPQLRRFAEDFAKLPCPIALDLDGALAKEWGAEGTPHWFVFDRDGALVRSVYGSQENAQTRLRYLVEELLQDGA